MQRRDFLRVAFGFAAGAVALAGRAQAAPLAPALAGPDAQRSANEDVRPAVTSSGEVLRLKPEEVHWGHHWHRRHWGWHHHWHRHWRRW